MLTFFFFNDTATTEIYTLSLHDALPICLRLDDGLELARQGFQVVGGEVDVPLRLAAALELVQHLGERLLAEIEHHVAVQDRKSTRLNSSHLVISYAVFCFQKKNNPCPHI